MDEKELALFARAGDALREKLGLEPQHPTVQKEMTVKARKTFKALTGNDCEFIETAKEKGIEFGVT